MNELLLIASMTCTPPQMMRIIQNSQLEVVSRDCTEEFTVCPAGYLMGGFQLSSGIGDYFYCRPEGADESTAGGVG